MGGHKLIASLQEAAEIARLASEVAIIIQQSQEDDVSASRTAYRILGHLGLANYHERPSPTPERPDEP